MQFFATASLFAAAVSGAAVHVRQQSASGPGFEVSQFVAKCLPHGGLCFYNFDVSLPTNGTSTECNNSVRGDGSLPPLEDGQCDDPAITFNVQRPGNASILFEVTQSGSSGTGKTGSITINPSQIQKDEDNQEVYTGPKNFQLKNVN